MYNAGYMDELRANREDNEVCRAYLDAVRGREIVTAVEEEDVEITVMFRVHWNGQKNNHSGLMTHFTRVDWFSEYIKGYRRFGHEVVILSVEKGMQVYGIHDDLFDAYHGIGKYRR